MNKAFKVLWNDARRSFVVSSETQRSHGKPKKFTKTLLATALTGLMAVSTGAFASITVDRDYVNGIDSTKFIHGNGEELVIKTNGDVRKFVADIKKAIEGYQTSAAGGNPNELGLINAIREALSQTNYGDNAILTGTVGGNNFIDQSTISELGKALGLISSFNQNYKGLCDAILDELNKQFENQQKDVTSTKITIGGEGTNPFMIGTVAGDRVINAISGNSEVYAENKMESVISGNTVIEANSGNLLGLTGGSSAVNISGVDISFFAPPFIVLMVEMHLLLLKAIV